MTFDEMQALFRHAEPVSAASCLPDPAQPEQPRAIRAADDFAAIRQREAEIKAERERAMFGGD